jgi:hypothetical protein
MPTSAVIAEKSAKRAPGDMIDQWFKAQRKQIRRRLIVVANGWQEESSARATTGKMMPLPRSREQAEVVLDRLDHPCCYFGERDRAVFLMSA